MRILHADLQDKFGIREPCIAVLGLNPHAGEGGHLGREEIEVITPLLEQLRADGMHLLGPLPADTAFSPKLLAQADAYLAMFHDQGLPVLKYAGFGTAVNITLGLPIVRTSGRRWIWRGRIQRVMEVCGRHWGWELNWLKVGFLPVNTKPSQGNVTTHCHMLQSCRRRGRIRPGQNN